MAMEMFPTQAQPQPVSIDTVQMQLLLAMQKVLQEQQNLNVDVFANSIHTLASAFKTLADSAPVQSEIEDLKLAHEIEIGRLKFQHEMELERMKLELEREKLQLQELKLLGELDIKAAQADLDAIKLSNEIELKKQQAEQANKSRTSDV